MKMPSLKIEIHDIIFFSPCRCWSKRDIDDIDKVWGLVKIEIAKSTDGKSKNSISSLQVVADEKDPQSQDQK